MREDFYNLLAVQEVDNEIDELKRHKKDYPVRIEELRATISRLKQEREERQARLEELEKSLRHFQRRLESAKESLEKHQARLSETSNSREYDAVQQEIVAIKHSVDEFEMELLKADEEKGEVQRQLDEGETEFQEQIEACETEIEELEKKTADIDGNVDETKQRREQCAESLPRRLKMMYDRIRRGKNLAAARVIRGACSGCWKNIAPQQINELRQSAKITVCESCGRILIWDDREES